MQATTVEGAWFRGPRSAIAGLAVVLLLAFGAPAALAETAQPRIVGGHDAVAPNWPSVAFMVAFEDPAGDGTLHPSFSCAGTVVAPQWVLTAAHCVLGADGRAVPELRVKPGAGRIDDPAGRYVVADQVVVDPAYDRATLRADVALVRLPAPVAAPAMRIAGPDDLASGRLAMPEGVPNTAGWGATDPGAATISPALQEGYLRLQGDDTCRAAHGGYDAALMLCAVTPDETAVCHGDSGGPLTAVDTQTGERVLVGITSFGKRACSLQTPAYFVRVSAAGAFIAQQLLGDVAAPPPSATAVSTGRPVQGTGATTTAGRRGPTVGALRLAPARFRAAGAAPQTVASRLRPARPRGSTLSFRVSQRSRVTVAVERRIVVRGRARWRPVGAVTTVDAASGVRRVRLTGRVGGRALAHGAYRVVVRATAAGGAASAPATARFSIVR